MGKDFREIRRSAPSTFKAPLKWKEPRKVFTCSISDFFIEEADTWRDEAWEIIRRTPHLTYQILTKRPERILDCLPDDWLAFDAFENVWLGTSCENQRFVDERIAELLAVPASVHFLSCEPLLGPINLIEWISPNQVQRIIAHSHRTGHLCGGGGSHADCECGFEAEANDVP